MPKIILPPIFPPNLPDVIRRNEIGASQDVSVAHGSSDKRFSLTRRGSTALKASSSPGQGCFPPTLMQLPRRVSTFFFIIHIVPPAHGVPVLFAPAYVAVFASRKQNATSLRICSSVNIAMDFMWNKLENSPKALSSFKTRLRYQYQNLFFFCSVSQFPKAIPVVSRVLVTRVLHSRWENQPRLRRQCNVASWSAIFRDFRS